MDCQEQPKKRYELYYLVTKYRMMPFQQKELARFWRDEGRIELQSCDECCNTGIVESMNGEDDIDKDICELCDNFETMETIEWYNEVGNMLKFLGLRGKKNGVL